MPFFFECANGAIQKRRFRSSLDNRPAAFPQMLVEAGEGCGVQFFCVSPDQQQVSAFKREVKYVEIVE